jgi:phosphotriesterase-related protein
MPQVETVRGRVGAASLGAVLMHEHIFVVNPEIQYNHPEQWGSEDARVSDAVRRLNELKAAGIDSIVDLTVLGLGRYIPRIKRVAEQTSLNILVATGLYTLNDLPFYFAGRDMEAMVDAFARDIEVGIADTGVRAAILKCATGPLGLTPGVEKALRAVARAQLRTGVPISTHSHVANRSGLDQQRILLEEGVDLGRVIIGHSGDSTDIGYLEALIENGSYLGMDKFGLDLHLPFEQRVEVVAEMCRRGHHGRMVLSHDAACYTDWLEEDDIPRLGANWNYLHISRDVIPALLRSGVTQEQVRAMLVDNPRQILGTLADPAPSPLAPGSRLRSQACLTEIIVIRPPASPVTLSCGGQPMVPFDSAQPAGTEPSAGMTAGNELGKRYTAPDDSGLEVLVTKAGQGTLSIGPTPLVVKQAAALPSSD